MRKTIVSIAATLLWAGTASADPDEQAVKYLLISTFNRPEARLIVDPVVVADGYAIAGWSQGRTGGRALLRKKADAWIIVLCAGDDIKSVETLKKIGLADRAAASLASSLDRAEKSISSSRRAMFSKFEGLVMMGESAHPHGQSHQ